jgi:hypothetical protein
MLQVSSFPDMSPSAEPGPFYFLELYGETSPKADSGYAQVLAAKDGSSVSPIYEYFWTLGLYDPPQQHESEEEPSQTSENSSTSRRRLHFHPATSAPSSGWGKFAPDSFAQVYVLFPRSHGWRVHEVAASVKYLAPVPVQKSFLQEMDKDLAALQPLLGVAGTAASAAGALGAGPAGSATGQLLDAVAKMKVGSVPQAPGFEWSVKKFTTWAALEPSGADSASKTDTERNPAPETEAGEIVDGIVWNLPPSMFETLGSRINGSVAVSLLPVSNQESPSSDLQPGIVRACATFPLELGRKNLPPDDYVWIRVHPQS